jgi:hypothetical protein
MADYSYVSVHDRDFSVPIDELHELTAQMFLGPPVHLDTVRRIERHLGAAFCPHFVRFVTEIGDGGAGVVGTEGWLELARVGDLPRHQDEYRELPHVARHTVFGGSGSGEAFAFRTDGTVLAIPHIGGPEDAIPQGDFAEFVRRLSDNRVFDR